MNKQIEFGLRVRKEFAECYGFDSWEELVKSEEEKEENLSTETLMYHLEEMVETAAEVHMSLLSDEHSDDGRGKE